MSFFFLFFLCCSPCLCASYIYPVAYQKTEEERHVFCLYQPHPYALSLIDLNVKVGESTVLLPASSIPASFKLLLDGTGFSFIDQGIIKVKKFVKRSPRIIEPSLPIYGMTQFEWCCGSSCMYMSAKEGDFFSIFHVMSDGETYKIAGQKGTHCRYPQKIGEQLFYIEENDGNFSLVCLNFLVQLCCTHIKNENPPKKMALLDFGQSPKAFLYMQSAHEGFCVEYSAQVNMGERNLEFSYYKMYSALNNHSDEWCKQKLFTFIIPFDLLRNGSSTRLYESILPLLPRHIENKIFFVSQDEKQTELTVNIFSYDLKSKEIVQKTEAARGQIFFAPRMCGEQIFYGFSTNLKAADVESAAFDLPVLK